MHVQITIEYYINLEITFTAFYEGKVCGTVTGTVAGTNNLKMRGVTVKHQKPRKNLLHVTAV